MAVHAILIAIFAPLPFAGGGAIGWSVTKNRPPAIIDPALLLLAYRSGIFPMADARDDPDIFWVEPKLRGILPLDGFRCSHSLARTLRRGRVTGPIHAPVAQVIEACAAPRPTPDDAEGETWISHRIAAAYTDLHAAGHAHSVECWLDGALVGGLYGVGFDRAFCGESMFSRVPDASKVALAWLVAALRAGGFTLLDCQFITPHLASMGAIEISQTRYLEMLSLAKGPPYSGAAGAASGAGAASLAAGFGALLAAAKSAGFSSSPGNVIAQSFTHTS